MAKPRTAWLLTPSALKTKRPSAAATIPVTTTITAVSDGMPPIFSLMPIATGVVTDLAASEAMVAFDAPSSQASTSAETIATTTPTSRPTVSANQARRSFGICSASGTASATVAGPSRKWTNCAPSK